MESNTWCPRLTAAMIWLGLRARGRGWGPRWVRRRNGWRGPGGRTRDGRPRGFSGGSRGWGRKPRRGWSHGGQGGVEGEARGGGGPIQRCRLGGGGVVEAARITGISRQVRIDGVKAAGKRIKSWGRRGATQGLTIESSGRGEPCNSAVALGGVEPRPIAPVRPRLIGRRGVVRLNVRIFVCRSWSGWPREAARGSTQSRSTACSWSTGRGRVKSADRGMAGGRTRGGCDVRCSRFWRRLTASSRQEGG